MSDGDIRNIQATISELRTELKNTAKQVTCVNLEKETVLKERDSLLRELNEARNELASLRIVCTQEKKDIERRKSDIENEEHGFETRRHEFDISFKKEKNEKLKELNRLNILVIKAKEEEKELQEKILFSTQKVDSYAQKVKEVLLVEKELEISNENKIKVEGEIERFTESSSYHIEALRTEVKKLEDILQRLIVDIEGAKSRKKKIDDEADIRVQDLKEYTYRVKEAWNKVFPGRNMPMLP